MGLGSTHDLGSTRWAWGAPKWGSGSTWTGLRSTHAMGSTQMVLGSTHDPGSTQRGGQDTPGRGLGSTYTPGSTQRGGGAPAPRCPSQDVVTPLVKTRGVTPDPPVPTPSSPPPGPPPRRGVTAAAGGAGAAAGERGDTGTSAPPGDRGSPRLGRHLRCVTPGPQGFGATQGCHLHCATAAPQGLEEHGDVTSAVSPRVPKALGTRGRRVVPAPSCQ